MKYTIKVNEVKGTDSNIKGFATLVFGEVFKITNVAIMENTMTGELFVAMPRYKSNEVDQYNKAIYKDICNPITKEFREELYAAILEEYRCVRENKRTEEVPQTETTEIPPYAVSVIPTKNSGSNLKGFARIVFEDCFVVNNVTVLQGKENLFVGMPSYKTKKMDENDRPIYQDVCYPITKEFREKLYGEILAAYAKEKEKRVETETGKPLNRREQIQQEERKKTPKKKESKNK